MRTTPLRFAAALVSFAVYSSLGLAQTPASTAPHTDTTAAAQAPAGAKLSDPEIVGVMEAANKGEVEQAKFAKKQSKSKPIKEFAQMMIDDHSLALKDLDNVTDRTKLKDSKSDLQKDLEKMAKEDLKKLKQVSGKELDKRYVGSQVMMHQGLLDKIDNVLLPSATNPQLKDYLSKMRTSVAAHLEKAKGLEAQ